MRNGLDHRWAGEHADPHANSNADPHAAAKTVIYAITIQRARAIASNPSNPSNLSRRQPSQTFK